MTVFKGQNAWEQRKLGDLGSVQMNKRIFKDQTSESGEVPFFKIGTFGKKPDSFISKKLFDEYKSKYPYPEVGDILISASGSIGRTVVYEGEDAYFQDSNIVWLEHDGRLKNSFLEQFLKRTKWNKIEGSTIKRLYNKDILNKKINLPKLKEQEKIGQLFQYLDKTITLHEEKHRQLEQLKKALLQKMFADETGYPVLRFKGFTKKWEQRKLEDLGEILTGSTPSTKHTEYYSKNGIPWVTPTDIKRNITFSTPRKLSALGESVGRIVPKNTLLITCIASIGKNTILGTKGSFNQQINGLIPRFDKYDLYFLFTQSNLWSQKMKHKAATGTMQIVNKKDFTNLNTLVPILSEQRHIGNMFEQLDHLITLHQHKIDNLKRLKRALLQKMFV